MAKHGAAAPTATIAKPLRFRPKLPWHLRPDHPHHLAAINSAQLAKRGESDLR